MTDPNEQQLEEYEDEIGRLHKRLWFERTALIFIAGFFAVAWGYPLVFPTSWAVFVADEPVVAMQDRSVLAAIVEQVKHDQAVGAEQSEWAQPVTIKEVRADQMGAMDSVTAWSKLREVLKVKARRPVIYVDDLPVVALSNRREADDVLDRLKRDATQKFRKVTAGPSFREKVEIRDEAVDEALWASVEDAVELLQGSRSADGPLVTVRAEGELVEERSIPYDTVVKTNERVFEGKQFTEAGASGKEVVRYQARVENGEVVSQKPVEKEVVEPVKPKVVVVGTGERRAATPNAEKARTARADRRSRGPLALSSKARAPGRITEARELARPRARIRSASKTTESRIVGKTARARKAKLEARSRLLAQRRARLKQERLAKQRQKPVRVAERSGLKRRRHKQSEQLARTEKSVKIASKRQRVADTGSKKRKSTRSAALASAPRGLANRRSKGSVQPEPRRRVALARRRSPNSSGEASALPGESPRKRRPSG